MRNTTKREIFLKLKRKPRNMTEKIEVDKTLTPENAKERGLEWVMDVIVDDEAPDDVIEDIVEMVKDGKVIGMPAASNPENNIRGVYKKKEE